MKKQLLAALLTAIVIAIAGVIGYQIGVSQAPKYDRVQLVMPIEIRQEAPITL